MNEAMVERMARMLFANTTEARSGFTWPINGDWGRARDMERAKKVLEFVLGDDARISASESHGDNALGYIDRTLDNGEGGTHHWRNDEVMTMLSDIRRMLTRDSEPDVSGREDER